MLIDITTWSHFSCRAATGWHLFYAFLAAVPLWFLIRASRRSAIRIDRRGAEYVWLGFLCVPVALVLIVTLTSVLQRTRHQIFTEGTSLVETGCYRLSDFRYTMPLEQVRGRYEFVVSKGRHDYVVFSAGKKYRELWVDLKNSTYLDNIRKLAPAAVDEYTRELGKGD